MTTRNTCIWLKKGFVRKSMKLQNIIETGIFTVHCLRRLLWLDNRFLKTRLLWLDYRFLKRDVEFGRADLSLDSLSNSNFVDISGCKCFDRYFRLVFPNGIFDRYFRLVFSIGIFDRYFFGLY